MLLKMITIVKQINKLASNHIKSNCQQKAMVETENRTRKQQNEIAAYGGEFESYLISALNDSLLKKSKFVLFAHFSPLD